jgi:hypothetical protein
MNLSPNRPWRPIGLWDFKDPTLSRQSPYRWRWGCLPYAPAAALLPRNILYASGSNFVWRLSNPQGLVRSKGLDKLIWIILLVGLEPSTFRLVAQYLNHFVTDPKYFTFVSFHTITANSDGYIYTFWLTLVIVGVALMVVWWFRGLRWRNCISKPFPSRTSHNWTVECSSHQIAGHGLGVIPVRTLMTHSHSNSIPKGNYRIGQCRLCLFETSNFRACFQVFTAVAMENAVS